MEFKLLLDGVEIGRSRLEHLDDGMGIARGDFSPSAGYTRVKPLFRRLSDACEAREVAAELWQERDRLALRVVDPYGTTVETGWIMIYDFGIEGTCEAEVKLLDRQQWERLSNGDAGGLPSTLLAELAAMPDELDRALGLIPPGRLAWRPESWGGCPAENFSALEQVCHLRDIEADGYHVRIQRMLEESNPSLLSLDGYEMARQRRYESADLQEALAAFRQARATTLDRLRTVTDVQLARAGEFAEYGRLTLRALVHYLRSHDQQHLAGIQWLAGKIASEA